MNTTSFKSKLGILILASLTLTIIVSVFARPRMIAASNQANTPPTISVGVISNVGLNRPLNNFEIARVYDTETKRGDLKVEVVSAAAGISVTNIANYDGIVFARIALDCPVSIGESIVVLKVTDGGGLSATGNLPVKVSDMAPRIYFASDVYGINLNGSATINEGPPTIQTAGGRYQFDAPGFGGQLSGNIQTGEVFITNAQPVGSFNVKVTLTNDCGKTASESFTLVVNPAVTACAAPRFAAPLEFDAPETGAMTADDFNGDGKTDLAVTSGLNLLFYPGKGDGTFGNPSLLYSGWQAYSPPLVGDFNKDGKKDLAVRTSEGVLILLGAGNGTFTLRYFSLKYVSGTGTFRSIALDDFNNDGATDIAAVFEERAVIFLSDGQGQLMSPRNAYFHDTDGIFLYSTAGDFNGDGQSDVAVIWTNSDNTSIYVLSGDGKGIVARVKEIKIASLVSNFIAGDYNRDGKKDFAVSLNTNQLATILTLGTWQFSEPQYSLMRNWGQFAQGDFNRDGVLDFAQSIDRLSQPQGFSILTQNGQGYICSDETFATNIRWLGFPTVGDFNGDGQPDLAYRNFEGKVRVFLNTTSGTTNQPPTITPAAPLTLSQGTTPANATTIATVRDAETPAGNLSVAATAVSAGITLSNLTNVNGTISARIAVECGTTVGQKVIPLTVTDANGASAQANLILNIVAAGDTLAIGSYPTVTMTPFAGTPYIFPHPRAMVNGELYFGTLDYTVRAPGFTGQIEQGAGFLLRFIGPALPGEFTVTVTGSTKDTCPPLTATTSFKLIVQAPMPVPNPVTFQPSTAYHTGRPLRPLALADFNNDGVLDVVSGGAAGLHEISLRLNNGKGGLGAIRRFKIQPKDIRDVLTVEARDFNRDGNQDLVIGYRAQSSAGSESGVSILLGDGKGNLNFSDSQALRDDSAPFSLGVTDFNNDSFLDVVTGDPNGNLKMMLGRGDGRLSLPVHYSSGFLTGYFAGLSAEDFNNDGNADLVFFGSSPFFGTVVRFGDGKGGFTSTRVFSAASSPFIYKPAAMGDFNQDGHLDFVELGSIGDVVFIYGDGKGDFSLQHHYLTTGYGAIATADFNGDGRLDVFLPSGMLESVSDGTYRATMFPSSFHLLGLAAGDMNADGKPDVVIANSSTGEITVLLNNHSPMGGCDAISFAEASNFDAAEQPYGTATGDLNGDGWADLVVTNHTTNRVSVLLSTEKDGQRAFQRSASYDVGADPRTVAISDFNNDGNPDFAVANHGSGTVTILVGNGVGGFGFWANVNVGGQPLSVSVYDFDFDGNKDFAIVSDKSDQLAVWFGDGKGQFEQGKSGSPKSYTVGKSPQPPVIGDFRGGGAPDVVIPNYTTGELVLLPAEGARFGTPKVFKASSSVEVVAAGDLNGDGKLDLVAANTEANTLTILLNEGASEFRRLGEFAIDVLYPASLAIADFNSDGKFDVAVGGYSDSTVKIFAGNGNGTFDMNRVTVVNVSSHPLGLLTNDFNGDGKPDLAIANNDSGTVSVLLNSCLR